MVKCQTPNALYWLLGHGGYTKGRLYLKKVSQVNHSKLSICSKSVMQLPSFGAYHVHTNNGTVYCVHGDQVFLRCLNSECTKHMCLNSPKDNIFALVIEQALGTPAGVQYKVPETVRLKLPAADYIRLKSAVKSARAGGDYHPTKGFGVRTDERVCGGNGAGAVWLRLTNRLANILVV